MLVAGFLALQLNALGGGVACLLASPSGYAGAVSVTMANMRMRTGALAGEYGIRGSAATQPDAGEPTQVPCHQSNAPQSSCQTMAVCSAAFASAPSNDTEGARSIPSGRIALIEVVPSSYSLSPDIPPPKA